MSSSRYSEYWLASLLLGLAFICSESHVRAQNAPPNPEDMFRQLDVNQDGKLTLEEQRGPGSREFMQRLYDMAKKPATGSISKDEFLRIAEQHRNGGRNPPGTGPGPGAGPGRPPRAGNGPPGRESGDMPPGFPPFLRALDSNNDQALSRGELSRLIERFDSLDTNGDGSLDLAELSAIDRGPVSESAAEDATPSKSGAKKPKAEGRPTGSAKPASGKAETGKTSSTKPGDAAVPRGQLAGVWRGWVVDGRGEDPDRGHLEMELTVTGNRMTARELGAAQRAQNGLGEGTFVVSAQGNSGNLDATQTAGQNQGREYRGIFELDGDTLKWCVGNRGTTRPRDFETGRGNYYMILHKQK